MSVTHRHTRSFSRSGVASVAYDKDVVGDLEINIEDLTVPAGTADMEVIVPIDVSELKSLFMSSDKALTVETNNPGGGSGVPDDTISLPANQPCVWAEGDPWDRPLTADVTKLWLTNAGEEDATFDLRALVDATP